jgi:hypothetical protein
MYLDTTILQSNTAIDLVSHIKRQMKIIENSEIKDQEMMPQLCSIKRDYDKIISLHNKAIRRREGNTKYNKSFVDLDRAVGRPKGVTL